jgi:glycosyltransferase involved in cell wall biosynthesis
MTTLEKVENWLEQNTYQLDQFKDLANLAKLKTEKGYSVAVVIPTLEEEETVGNVLECLVTKLMKQYNIIDEMIIIDGGSKDGTKDACSLFSDYVTFYEQSDILRNVCNFNGKGEALWKSLYVTKSDIVIYIDSDIKNFDERFVTGILGPMLVNDDIKFVKGYYKRPYIAAEGMKSNEGGRVTELCARPLLNILYPELSGFIQPLGGEYGGFRDVLENIEYTSGYGVEVQSLIEILEKFGLDCIAQSNLIERIHRHQPINSLSKMSSAIMQTILRRHIDSTSLNNTILIKNLMKENSSFVKSRSEDLLHCNCAGKAISNENFKYVEINEHILPCMSKIRGTSRDDVFAL